MLLSTEIKFDTAPGVSTEDRFRLRRWCEQMVGFLNGADWKNYALCFHERAQIEGFTDEIMDIPSYLAFMQDFHFAHRSVVARYPSMKVYVKRLGFQINGTFELIEDGVMTYEGNIEIVIDKIPEAFKIIEIHFYPHLVRRKDSREA